MPTFIGDLMERPVAATSSASAGDMVETMQIAEALDRQRHPALGSGGVSGVSGQPARRRAQLMQGLSG